MAVAQKVFASFVPLPIPFRRLRNSRPVAMPWELGWNRLELGFGYGTNHVTGLVEGKIFGNPWILTQI